jgi:hypothetical protein
MGFEYIKTLLATGLVAVVLVLCASSNLFTEFDYDTTQALISNIQHDDTKKIYQLTVSYSVNGTNYNGILMENSSDNKVGDNITIDYQKNDLTKISPHVNRTKLALSSCVGALACATMSYFTFVSVKSDIANTARLFK